MAEINPQKNAEHLHEELCSLKKGITALLKQLRGMKGIKGLRKKLRDQRREINQFLHLDNTQRLHEAPPSLKKPLLQILLQLKILQSIHEPVSSLDQRIEGFIVKFLNNSSNAPVRRTLIEDEGVEPLNKALKENGCEDVVGLLQEGEHVDTKDSQGNTRLLKAVEYPSDRCVEVLIEHGADIYASSNNSKVGLPGKTALARANFLVLLRGNKNPVFGRIKTAFQQKHEELEAEKVKAAEGPANGPAARFNRDVREAGCERSVPYLKEREDIDRKDEGGNTRLLNVVKDHPAKCVKVLLDHGASLDETNAMGETPAHKSAYHGKVDSLKLLLEAGADVNRVDHEGETAFHEAAYCRESDWSGRGREKYQAIAEMLRDKEVDRSIRNKEGDTAADIARRKCASLADKFAEQGESIRHRRSLALEREEETATIFPERVKPVEGRAVPGITHMEMQAGNNNVAGVADLGLESLAYTGMLLGSWVGLFNNKTAQSFKPERSTSRFYEKMNRAEQHLKEGEAKYGSKPMR